MLNQLLEQIDDYLTARSTVEDLETWLLSNLQAILDSGDKISIEIANQIDADLVELDEGLIDEATFKGRLYTYSGRNETITPVSSETEQTTTVSLASTANSITLPRWEVPLSEGRRYVFE